MPTLVLTGGRRRWRGRRVCELERNEGTRYYPIRQSGFLSRPLLEGANRGWKGRHRDRGKQEREKTRKKVIGRKHVVHGRDGRPLRDTRSDDGKQEKEKGEE